MVKITLLYYDDVNTTTTTTAYLYNDMDQLTKDIVGETETTYEYDDNGNLTKRTDDSTTYTYEYDETNRLTRYYDGEDATTYEYDDANRVTNLANKKSDATVISSFAYEHDDVGQCIKMTLANGDYLLYYYDDKYQLTKEQGKDSGNSSIYRNEFTYDVSGKLRHSRTRPLTFGLLFRT